MCRRRTRELGWVLSGQVFGHVADRAEQAGHCVVRAIEGERLHVGVAEAHALRQPAPGESQRAAVDVDSCAHEVLIEMDEVPAAPAADIEEGRRIRTARANEVGEVPGLPGVVLVAVERVVPLG